MASPNLQRVGYSSLTYNAKACRYVGATGRFLSPQRVREVVDADIANRAERMQRLAAQVASGEINSAEFGAQMRKEVKAVHLVNVAAARGGFHNMGAQGFSQAGGLLPFHYQRLNSFVADIANGRYGEPMDAAQIADRAAMYSEAGRESFEHVRLGQEADAGFRSEVNVLEATAHHCTGPDSCPAQSKKGRVPIGTLLIPGQRACVTRCKCRIERFKAA